MNIKCPGCKAENKEGAKFCKECGTSFASLVACPACSALVKPGKFCAACGHNFSAPPAAAEENPSPETIETIETIVIEPTVVASSEALVIDLVPPPPIAVEQADAFAETQPVDPIAEVKVPTPPAMPLGKGVLNDAKTSAFVPGQPVRKANFKAVYALIPFAIVIAGGIYWWKSNSAQTAIHPSSEMPTSSVEIQVPAAVSPPNPKSAPTAESAPNPAPVPTSEPASQIPAIPESEPSPAEAPVTKAVSAAPVLRKVPPVAPANSQHAKRESAKVPAASAKPDTAGKSVGMVNPPVASAQPPAKAVVPKSAAPAKTLDALYQDRITAECPQGFFPGFACREKVRWQVCDGKWSPDAIAGQTTCKGSGSK